MSISVSKISVSIKGIQSEGHYIELQESRFVLDEFELTQQLLQPCHLSFTMGKDTQEDINDVQFNVCSYIIGAEVTLVMETSSMEEAIESFEENGQNDILEFEGFITGAFAFRNNENEYRIAVECVSKDGHMMSAPQCYMFNDYKLDDIVKEVASEYANYSEREGKAAWQEEIHYTVQYNESDYRFLARLATRYGEWMFSTGKKLHFGALENQESIEFTYPSQDITDYSVSLVTHPMRYAQYGLAYNHRANMVGVQGDRMGKNGNMLNDTTYEMSLEAYPRRTRFGNPAPGLESDKETDGYKKQNTSDDPPSFFSEIRFLNEDFRSNMVVYRGTSLCSRLKIGSLLTIKDNYISPESGEKSEVKQDEIIITGVTHSFGVNADYQNHFEGIPSAIKHPPYLNTLTYPRCDHPVRAVVIDNDDPRHEGRVRVRFNWQLPEYNNKHGNREKNGMTPWIHVAQPYNGGKEDQGGYYGMHLIPELYTTVMVDFEEGNYERPYVLHTFFENEYHVDDAWCPGKNNVKAFRTASGHTIEIHDTQDEKDAGDGGFIHIYDDKQNFYEVLLSTDEKLIKLRSSGNIELYADHDIIMKAGNDIKVTAGHDKNLKVGHDYSISVKNDETEKVDHDHTEMVSNNYTLAVTNNISETANNEFTAHSDKDMTLTTSANYTLQSEGEMYVEAEKDYMLNLGGNSETVVKKDQSNKVQGNADFSITQALQLSGKDITIQAQNELNEYSVSQNLKASNAIGINATATIDIKAMMIKEN